MPTTRSNGGRRSAKGAPAAPRRKTRRHAPASPGQDKPQPAHRPYGPGASTVIAERLLRPVHNPGKGQLCWATDPNRDGDDSLYAAKIADVTHAQQGAPHVSRATVTVTYPGYGARYKGTFPEGTWFQKTLFLATFHADKNSAPANFVRHDEETPTALAATADPTAGDSADPSPDPPTTDGAAGPQHCTDANPTVTETLDTGNSDDVTGAVNAATVDYELALPGRPYPHEPWDSATLDWLASLDPVEFYESIPAQDNDFKARRQDRILQVQPAIDRISRTVPDADDGSGTSEDLYLQGRIVAENLLYARLPLYANGRLRREELEARVSLIVDGQLELLYDRVSAQTPPRRTTARQPLPNEQKRRVSTAIHQGHLGKALRICESSQPPLPLHEWVLTALRAKFPQPHPAEASSTAAEPSRSSFWNVKKWVSHIASCTRSGDDSTGAPKQTYAQTVTAARVALEARGKHCESAGYSPLRSRCYAGDTWALLYDVLLCLLGRLTPSTRAWVRAARLIALQKPPPEGAAQPAQPGVRPISIGCGLRRFAASIACSRLPSETTQAMHKAGQYGVGIPGGTETIIHSVRLYVETKARHEDVAVVKADLKNCFGLLPRPALRDLFIASAPHLLPLFDFLYDGPTPLYFTGGTEKGERLEATTGMLQGCGLSGLGACLFVGRAMEQALKGFEGTVHSFGYIDDVTLCGPAEATCRAARAYCQYLQLHAPGMVVSKVFGYALGPTHQPTGPCTHVLSCRDAANKQYTLPADGIWEDGATFGLLGATLLRKDAGTPIQRNGDGIWRGTFRNSTMNFLEDFAATHPHPTYLILKYVSAGKPTHWLRNEPPSWAADLADHHDASMLKILGAIAGLPELEPHAAGTQGADLRAHLPVSYGGAGLRSARQHSPGAYLAGFARAARTVIHTDHSLRELMEQVCEDIDNRAGQPDVPATLRRQTALCGTAAAERPSPLPGSGAPTPGVPVEQARQPAAPPTPTPSAITADTTPQPPRVPPDPPDELRESPTPAARTAPEAAAVGAGTRPPSDTTPSRTAAAPPEVGAGTRPLPDTTPPRSAAAPTEIGAGTRPPPPAALGVRERSTPAATMPGTPSRRANANGPALRPRATEDNGNARPLPQPAPADIHDMIARDGTDNYHDPLRQKRVLGATLVQLYEQGTGVANETGYSLMWIRTMHALVRECLRREQPEGADAAEKAAAATMRALHLRHNKRVMDAHEGRLPALQRLRKPTRPNLQTAEARRLSKPTSQSNPFPSTITVTQTEAGKVLNGGQWFFAREAIKRAALETLPAAPEGAEETKEGHQPGGASPRPDATTAAATIECEMLRFTERRGAAKGAFLRRTPTHDPTVPVLSKMQYRMALAECLGVTPGAFRGAHGFECICGAQIPSYNDMVQHVDTQCHALRTTRHDGINRTMQALAKQVGLIYRREGDADAKLQRAHPYLPQSIRADAVIVGGSQHGGELFIDFTCIDPTARTNRKTKLACETESQYIAKLLTVKEYEKELRQSAAYRHQGTVLPCAISVGGFLGPGFNKLLDVLCARAAGRSWPQHWATPSFRSYASMKLSTHMHSMKWNAIIDAWRRGGSRGHRGISAAWDAG